MRKKNPNKIAYGGVTTEISDKLFEPIVITKNKPKVSNRFDVPSLYYDGKYYFTQDLKERCNPLFEGTEFEIQVVYYSYKWYQDTFYITRKFRDFLLEFVK